MAERKNTQLRRVVQIAVADGEEQRTILALCDDSTIWRYVTGGPSQKPVFWTKLIPVPGTEPGG